ncbi:patatin-like phospholipase family protein [Tahibacter amnicola]|uniref:Patatin-like phospholipase family protein n=1 Tax=Tahibacter amnicola TaxID=2976241 RepID=A0ABY6BFZ2_9GAMM|nr:patatin-like phospholipase family protein [Tahibacter amnicola]UXI68437.1 patatin-like phospholipase family protein [Tahibacter amnicola]
MTDALRLPVSDVRQILREAPLFQHLDEAELDQLEQVLEWSVLPGGATLFEEGDISDALYVLRSGSLGAFRVPRSGGVARLIGLIAAGESVGELGLIVDQPRSATVRALRDSELLRLSRAGFDALVQRQPRAMLQAARIAVERLLVRRTGEPLSVARTFAVIPHDPGVDITGFSRALQAALRDYGSCSLLDAVTGAGHTSAWYSAQEAQARFVLYQAGPTLDAWHELCVRQADALIFVANAVDQPAAWTDPSCTGAEEALHRPRHLVLWHARGEIQLGRGAAWLAQVKGARLHHWCGPADVERIARLIAGRSLGLVLSGGGARGFAHIGVIKAVREAGLRIDSVGGTSIGAIIAAGVAAGWSDEEMLQRYRRAFVDGRPLKDYTWPFLAMTTGRRVSRLLREAFGERHIEDLALPYFAVSANLTSGDAVTHRTGLLWYWLRASSAIPGVLPPVFHQGQVLVDGAVINNLPTDVMRDMAVGDVIGVDIGADDVLRAEVEEVASPSAWQLFWEQRRPARPGLVSILLRAGMVNSKAANADRRQKASLLLTPPVTGVGLLDWQSYERAIELGYQYALRVIGGQKDALADDTPLL